MGVSFLQQASDLQRAAQERRSHHAVSHALLELSRRTLGSLPVFHLWNLKPSREIRVVSARLFLCGSEAG